MNLVALVMHGLAAISVFSGVVGVRLLIGCCITVLLITIGTVLALTLQVTSAIKIPATAAAVILVFMMMVLQSMFFAAAFCFDTLRGAKPGSFSSSPRLFILRGQTGDHQGPTRLE